MIILVNKAATEKIILQTIEILEAGGVILYPADTIWGIGCDAANPRAIEKVYEIKGRRFNQPMILLVSNLQQLYQVVTSVHPRVDTLLSLHERPLTVIYPSAREPYQHLTGPDGTIAVRIVRFGFCHELIEAYGKPLISTSANQSGEPTPSRFGTISSAIIAQVDMALPAFTEEGITGTASVIARYDANGELDFIRTQV